MVRSKDNIELIESVTPTWEIIENIRIYLTKKYKRRAYDLDINEELGISQGCMANMKNKGTRTLIMYVTIWCVRNDLDVRDFIKDIR